MNKRQKEVAQSQLNDEKAVLKKLEANYKDALEEINSKIELLMARQDADMQHVIYQVEYQKALKTQVQGILDKLQADEFETISEYLTKSYEEGFLGTMYDLHGQGIPLIMPIDQEQVVAAIQHETKLSESLYTKLGKDIKLLNKQIASEISRGIAGGHMYREIARNIAGYAGIGKNKAMRIARTEAHRIQSTATANAQFKAKDKGADIVKIWSAALDAKTRTTHRKLDGQIRELEEPFEVDGMKAMHPASFGRPEEDINCRCRSNSRARWLLEQPYTKWDANAPVIISDDGTTQYSLIESKNYEDFKKKYKQASERVRENVQKMNDKGTSQEKTTTISFKNKKEAENWFNDKGVEINSKNFDLEYLNKIATFNADFEQKFDGYMKQNQRKLGAITSTTKGMRNAAGKYSFNANTLDDGEIFLRDTKSFDELMKEWKNHEDNFYSGKDVLHLYAHEYGHYISDTLNINNAKKKQVDILREVFKEMSEKHDNFPSFNPFRMPDVSEYASRYGSANTDELFAELFAEYFTEEKPREMAKIFGGKLEEIFKEYASPLEKAGKSSTIELDLQFFADKTKHASERAIGRSVSDSQIDDAIKNPLFKGNVVIDEQGRKSVKYIGNDATVVLNPDTEEVVTTWKTGSRTKKKYGKGD